MIMNKQYMHMYESLKRFITEGKERGDFYRVLTK